LRSPDDLIDSRKRSAKRRIAKEFSSVYNERVDKAVSLKLEQWGSTLRLSVFYETPFINDRKELNAAEMDNASNGATPDAIYNDLKNLKKLSKKEDITFWSAKCDKLLINRDTIGEQEFLEDLNSLRLNALRAWRRIYDDKLIKWQMRIVRRERKKLLTELREWITHIVEINRILREELDVTPGTFWDDSLTNLSTEDLSFLREWTEYVKKDRHVKELCEMLGRMKNELKTQKEDLMGIELGRNIEEILPHELSLLGDDLTSILFDLKYAEGQLMCFRKQGSDENLKAGPMVICIDTSGSMEGFPENTAKAISLALSARALSEGRKCYLINFSIDIETLDVSPPKGIADLIGFLKRSHHGGTDICPALNEGITVMKGHDYKKADLIVLSDFLMPDLDPPTLLEMNRAKRNGARFFSLSIGELKSITETGKKIFDVQWGYDPRRRGIVLLNAD
jgi:uncharacterized protein with von Willebrand factor type A (vWA) domain